MHRDEPLSSAERTALNVFHDLELAHTRQNDEDPTPATSTDGPTSGAQRQSVPAGPDVAAAV